MMVQSKMGNPFNRSTALIVKIIPYFINKVKKNELVFLTDTDQWKYA